MSDRHRSVPESIFDAKYARDPDPWDYQTSPYELGKYQITLDALTEQQYQRALEIGCSIGVFTSMLAKRCRELLAVDASSPAIDLARNRCVLLPQVQFARMSVPDEFPDGSFDLIVLSEVGYYWSMHDLLRASRLVAERLTPGGTAILVHWTAPIDDAPLTGDEVHAAFQRAAAGLVKVTCYREERFRLDLYRRPVTDVGKPRS
jgi:SAM-dependent methyltransferase